MKELKEMKEALIRCAQPQMANLANVNTKEMGEVIDMIKDLAEATYYCTITKAMEEKEHEEKYYPRPYPPMYQQNYYPNDEREMDREQGRMYYSGGNGTTSSGGNNARGGGGRGYSEQFPNTHETMMNRSEMSRRNYMESKHNNQKPEIQMRELNNYMQELSNEITEMIQDASPEEKVMLQQRLNTLASKIQK